MSFLRHARSIGPMGTNRGAGTPLLIVRDGSHRLSLGGLPSSRAPFRFARYVDHAVKGFRRSSSFHRTANCGLTDCLGPGVHRTAMFVGRIVVGDDCLSADVRLSIKRRKSSQSLWVWRGRHWLNTSPVSVFKAENSRRRPVALVIMSHGPRPALLHR
jgi:hypothetical protein